MSIITELTETTICIRLDNGDLREVNRSELSFEPIIGDEVEVFIDNLTTIVVKKEIYYNSNSSDDSKERLVGKVEYCFMAFFLGGIGLHKFYAGKMVWGFCTYYFVGLAFHHLLVL